ncbi:MAG: phosphatase PAP2 family protein [Chlamydiae bacterium]|nr:phosphatase PAP2 family protein [Chlamydiota bacterium]
MWRKKTLLIIHLFSLLLGVSALFPTFWKALDTNAFYFFNSLITNNYYIQVFWAFCNTKTHNWVFDVIVIAFLASYILCSPKELRANRAIKVSTAFGLMMLLFFFDHFFFNRYLYIQKKSPTFELEGIILRDVVPWLKAKWAAKRSYPAGHAITAFLFLSIMGFATNRRWTIAATILTIPLLIMPRLVSGAHWLSDVLLGSFLMTMIPASWIFCTPIFPLITQRIESYAQKRNTRSSRSDTA